MLNFDLDAGPVLLTQHADNHVSVHLRPFSSDCPTYLSEPLLLGVGDHLVGPAHHGDQHVHQQDRHHDHVHTKDGLAEVIEVKVTGGWVGGQTQSRYM